MDRVPSHPAAQAMLVNEKMATLDEVLWRIIAVFERGVNGSLDVVRAVREPFLLLSQCPSSAISMSEISLS